MEITKRTNTEIHLKIQRSNVKATFEIRAPFGHADFF